MPELPEVRALAERLDAATRGRRIDGVALLGFSGLKTVSPALSDLIGHEVTSVTSTGKFVRLDVDDLVVLVHLGNAGRVDVEQPAKVTRPRGSLVRISLGDLALLVREHGSERRAGLWVLATGDPGPLGALGPEPHDAAFEEFVLSSTDRRTLHTVLRDQRTVAGVGRGYADDALNRAGLSPFASLARLDVAARHSLVEAVRDVLDEALVRERERTGGLSASSLGGRFAVHRRFGEPCPRCGRRLERVSFESNEIVYCPSCQTKGRLLADRRLSRLLR